MIAGGPLPRFLLRPLVFVAGCLCVALATLGIFLPLLPTTPFLLLAAWLFARSSQRVHGWLLQHRLFGPVLADWERHGVVRTRVKWTATILMIALLAYPLSTGAVHPAARIAAGATAAGVLVFLWTRPAAPPPGG